MTKRTGWIGLCAIALLSVATSVASAQFSIHGNAYLVDDAEEGTVVEIASLTAWPTPGFGGHWQYTSAPGSLFFHELTELRYDYRFLPGSGYAPGSPRLMIQVDVMGTLRNVEIHFTAPVTTEWTTDDILASPDARYNLTTLGGPYYGTYAQALALIGMSEITYIWIPIDGGWLAPQYVRLDNFTVNGVTADANYVVDTRDQDLIDDLNAAVTNAHNLTVALPNSNAYVNLAKTADGQAWAAHNAAAGVGYFNEADFPAALAKYKQFRYQQVTYNGRAAQYLAYGGAPANGAPKTAHQTAKTYGNVDFNAP